LIKSVKPVFDVSKITKEYQDKFSNDELLSLKEHSKQSSIKLDNLNVNMICEFCEGSIHKKPIVLKFANIERFFCCTSCRNDYKEKYGGRIQSIIEKFEEDKKN
jgi:Lrp/AsnC family leucine-responsive transcriptional regulator